MGLGWKHLFLGASCLLGGCAFSSTDYCVLSGRLVRPGGKPAAYCDLYLARSRADLERGSRPFTPGERKDFGLPGENLYRFVKTDGEGRFQTVFRIHRHGAHPRVYYAHPLPKVFLQVETAPGEWARFSLDTEWGDWSSTLGGDLKPMDLGELLLDKEPLHLPEPPPLRRSYMHVLEFPPQATRQGARMVETGERSFRAGRFLDAARFYRKAAQWEPRSPLAFYLAAESLFRGGKPREALLFARQALLLDPWVGRGHFLLALILERQGRRKEGLAELFRAVQLDPDLEEARSRLEAEEPRARPFRKTPLVEEDR